MIVLAGVGVSGNELFAGAEGVDVGGDPEEPEDRNEGAATAVVGSLSAPTPHGIGALVPGWTAFAGGTVLPFAAAIVKRVVQVLVAVLGLLY